MTTALQTSTLSAHSGAHVVSLADLAALPNPKKLGRIHTPVRHDRFVAALKEVLDDRGYAVRREQYAIQSDGAKLFGAIDFTSGNDERAVALGFRHGNDQSFPMTMVAGARVFVCDNLCLSGEEVVLRRKHTSGFDLYLELRDAASRFIDAYARLDQTITRFQNLALGVSDMKTIIYDAFVTEEVLPMRHLPTVNKWYFAPPAEATDCAPRTVWGLSNAFTRTIKDVKGINNQQVAATAVGRYLDTVTK